MQAVGLCAAAVLLTVGLCAAVGEDLGDDTFQLEGDHYHPSVEETVMAKAKILDRVGERRKMHLLEKRISELTIKNRVKDERIATLELSQAAHHHEELGEGESTNSKETRVPTTREDAEALKYLPEDVRDEVRDFYTLGIDSETQEPQDEAPAEKSPKHTELTMSDDFPSNFGSVTVADGTHADE